MFIRLISVRQAYVCTQVKNEKINAEYFSQACEQMLLCTASLQYYVYRERQKGLRMQKYRSFCHILHTVHVPCGYQCSTCHFGLDFNLRSFENKSKLFHLV